MMSYKYRIALGGGDFGPKYFILKDYYICPLTRKLGVGRIAVQQLQLLGF